MTEKVCKLYEEEQVGKTREGRKAVPANKMPNLGWDIAETQLFQKDQGNNDTHMTLILHTVITITIMLATFLEHITACAKKIPTLAEKIAQAVKSTITKASRNGIFQNINDSYKTTVLAITIATNMKNRTSRNGQTHRNNRNRQTTQARENSMTSTTICTSHTHPGPRVTTATSTTSCSTVSVNFTQRLNTEMETPKHRTLNNTLVLRIKVLNSTWKLSANHAPYIHKAEIHQDKRIILYEGLKLENQHTRKTLGTLSWVYKPSNYPRVIRWQQSLLVVSVTRPASN